MRWLLTMVVAVTVVALAGCSGGGGNGEESPTATLVATPTEESSLDAARRIEEDDDPSLPGEFVDLQTIYGGSYGATLGTNTGSHVTRDMDYETEQGLPPAGGPHWSSAPCGNDPAAALPFCGPVSPGIYRAPDFWSPESLVHSMEHASVVIWYNTSDQAVIDALEAFALEHLTAGRNLVLTPYEDIPSDTVAITTWSRRDIFPAADLTIERLQRFLDAHYCRFDPEGFCG